MPTHLSPPETSISEQLRDESHDWLLRLTSGRTTQADARAFRQWCEQGPQYRQAFVQARELWQALDAVGQISIEPSLLTETLAQSRVVHARRYGRRAFLGGAVAASLAFLVLPKLIPEGVFGREADFVTAVGEQRRVMLSADTMLELNTDTQVRQHRFADGAQGIEVLKGELAVQTSASLRVIAGPGELRIRAAQVNVRVDSDHVCATCLAGKLNVFMQEQKVQLSNEHQLSYSTRGLGAPVKADMGEVAAWREQMLVFHDQPLATVIDEINRYRPGMILLLNKELGQRRVQARFTLQQLGSVAQLIREAYGATVRELPGGVLLVT